MANDKKLEPHGLRVRLFVKFLIGNLLLAALLITGGILLIFFFSLSAFTGIWTDRLWFRSVDYGSVFTTTILTKTSLFIGFGVVFAALLLHRTERVGPRLVLGAALVVAGGALIAAFR